MNSKVKKLDKKVNKRIKRIKRKVRKLTKNMRKKPRARGMYAATTKGFRKDFQVLSQSGNTMRVKGRDLVYSIPTSLSSENDCDIITVIPCNPAYWTGTRISAIASGYQNYRPLKFRITYVPQCAVTQQGNVLGGTLWSMSPNNENLQQTLRTSNGGMLTQCYKSKAITVQLKRNLQFNLFRTGGKFDQQSNPFIFMALSIACVDSNNNKIVPGYFYVTYEYELKNPIGNTISYVNSNLVKKSDQYNNYLNSAAVVCKSSKISIGSILQVDDGKYFYNEEEKNLEENDFLWYFCNSSNQNNIAPEPEPEPIPEPDPIIIQYDATGTGTGASKSFTWGVLVYIVNEGANEVDVYSKLRTGSNGNQNWSMAIADGWKYYVQLSSSEGLNYASWYSNNSFAGNISAITYNSSSQTIDYHSVIKRDLVHVEFEEA